MLTLNLPPFKHRLENIDGQEFIFDIVRKKNIVNTPEEWVRQHLIHFLINEHKVPRSLISCEKGLSYNKLKKRTDVVILGKKGTPLFLIECKAPEVKISKETLIQSVTYNQTIKAPYIILSNGLVTVCFDVRKDAIKQIDSIPDYLTEEIIVST